jgi:hypothetical protein
VGAFLKRVLPCCVLLSAPALGSCSSKSTSHDCGPATDTPPDDLACAGLYSDFESKAVVKSARPFAPAIPFFSDGYEKARYLDLPDGQTIDATAPDDWKFPVGTKVWKEFRSGGRKIETRLLWKVAADRWQSAAYVWSEDGESAKRGENTNLTVDGLPYHVPSRDECNDCHKGKKDTLLGVEAISLAQPPATGVTLAVLVQENRITPPPAKTSLTIDPGVAQLHINCGVSCHNATSAATRKDSKLRLRVSFDEAANKPLKSWELYTTTVNVPASVPAFNRGLIIQPGAPDKSVIITAMTTTFSTDKMPPKLRDVDVQGVGAISTFIKSLPPP